VVVEALVHAVSDGAVVVEGSEDQADVVQHIPGAGDVEVGLLLAGEGGVGQILGSRRRADRNGGRTSVYRHLFVSADHGPFQGFRKFCLHHPLADGAARLGQGRHVTHVELFEQRVDALRQPVVLQKVAEGLGGGGEAVRHAHTGL